MSVTISGSNGIEVPTSSRISGDFSNATVASRTIFQTNVTNGATVINAVPNGTNTGALAAFSNSSDPDNAAYCYIGALATSFRFEATALGTGAMLPMTFYAGGYQRMKINTDGRVVIGPADIGPRGGTTLFSNFGSGVSDPNLALVAVGTAQGQNVGVTFAPTFTGTGDNGPRRAADIWASYSGVWGTEKLSFGVGVGSGVTSNDTNLVTTERLILSKDGVMAANGAVLGYGPGSGGTVTQATSKSTAVTLNKPSGQITMNDAALAAGTTVIFVCNNTFAVTNAVCAANLLHGSVADVGNYRLEVLSVGSGLLVFRLVNGAGASLSESPIIKFTVFQVAVA